MSIPLPPNAKRVFKGVIFDVYQWEQTMYNGTTEIFEKLKRPNTVNVIATVGDKILIQSQEQPDRPEPFISIPGGRCEENENPLDAIKREMLKETGYTSKNWELWKEERSYSKIIWTIYTYVARDCQKTHAPKLDAGEKIDTSLVTFDQFLALADDPAFLEKNMVPDMLRARFEPAKKEELSKILFPKL